MSNFFNFFNCYNKPTINTHYDKKVINTFIHNLNSVGEIINNLSDIDSTDPQDFTPVYKDITKYYRIDTYIYKHKSKDKFKSKEIHIEINKSEYEKKLNN